MSLPELTLDAAVGFAGSVRNGFHLHPDGESRVYPLGATIAISRPRTDSKAREGAPTREHQTSHITFLHGHAGEVTALAVSSSGRFIASGESISSGVAEIILWEACNEAVGTTWYGKKAKQYCLAQVLVAKAKKYASNAAFTSV